MDRRDLLKMALAAGTGWAICRSASADTPREATGKPDREPALSTAEMESCFELFTALLLHAPPSFHETLMSASIALYAALTEAPWRDRSPQAPQRLAADVRAVLQRVRHTYPVLRLEWTGAESHLAAVEPVPIHDGILNCLLVELHNTGLRGAELGVFIADPLHMFAAPARVAPGEMRWGVLHNTVLAPADRCQLVLTANGRDYAHPVALDRRPTALIHGVVTERDGSITAARVTCICADGLLRFGEQFAGNETLSAKPILPLASRPRMYHLPFFYCDGRFQVRAPLGDTELQAERGCEHAVTTQRIQARREDLQPITLQLTRLTDMKAQGWISGDTHVHWAKNSWDVNEEIELLGMVQRAEDIRCVNNLTLKHVVPGVTSFIAPSQFPMGPVPGWCDDEYHIQMAEEYRNEWFFGHINLLGIKTLIEPISTGKFMGGTYDYPNNVPALKETHRQGGVTCEAHGLGLNWDVPVNLLNSLSDCLDQIEPVDYYRFLDCGFRVPLGNGSDHPARVTGCARMYVKHSAPGLYAGWLEGIRQKRTFVTSGPLLWLQANGADIGDVLKLRRSDRVQITARALSRHPLGRVQLVVNGKVVEDRPTESTDLTITHTLELTEPSWVCVRCGRLGVYNALAAPDVAHTSAIYLHMDGRRRCIPEAALELAKRMHAHADDIQQRAWFANDAQRRECVDYIRNGARQFETMAAARARNGWAGRRPFSTRCRPGRARPGGSSV